MENEKAPLQIATFQKYLKQKFDKIAITCMRFDKQLLE